MRLFVHRLLFRPARVVFLGAGLITLVSCAPTRGYVGPELPKEQVAVVSLDADQIKSATADGLAFDSSGISLLPGDHRFQFVGSQGDNPYNCRPYSRVDSYGFERCQKEREDDIRNRKKDPRECQLSQYTKHRQTCLRNYRDVSCETTLTLQPGREYELGLSPSILTPPVVVAALVSGSFLNKARAALPVKSVCRVERMRTEEEDREATR